MKKENPIEGGFEPREHGHLYSIAALITAVALFLLSIQAYSLLFHPEPVNIPTLQDVEQFLGEDLDKPFSSHSADKVKEVVASVRSNIKQVANFIAARSCSNADRVCQSKAIFYFVRDEIQYVPDEKFHDRLENPLTVLKTGGADCEDMSVLLIALQKAIGNETRLVFVPGHAFAQVKIPNYKGDSWINMEATCDSCQFGELPNISAIQNKTYFEI